ncbi:MAG: accessory gene regulator ArgB-like protein [bacterium]
MMIKWLCKKIGQHIQSKNLTSKNTSDLQYGLEILIRFLLEFILVVFLAYQLNILHFVFPALFSFIILRRKAGGAHNSKYILCILSTVVVFNGIGYLTQTINFTTTFLLFWLIFTALLGIIFITKYAPADTEKIPITDKQQRKTQKRKSMIIFLSWFLLSLIFYVFPIMDTKIVFAASLGILAEIISLHPLTCKLLI